MKSIRALKGIGESRAAFFERRGVFTIEELLYYLPRDYEDRSRTVPTDCLAEGEEACVSATVFSPVRETRIRKNMTIYSMKVYDDGGIMSVIWYNNRFVKGAFKTGERYIFYGKVTRNRGMWEMANPIYERPEKARYTGRIMPIYPIGANITQKTVQSAVLQALSECGDMKDCIPSRIREEYHLCQIKYALSNIHFPSDFNARDVAHKRLAFEELYFMQLALMQRKKGAHEVKKIPFPDVLCVEDFIKRLPFELTGAQRRVIGEICSDFKSGKLMSRLVQGDVGSGKTAVAAAAMYTAAKNGFQSVIMAPTEILARQHFETFSAFFEGTGIRLELLCGSTKKKKEVYERIRSGEAVIVVGTHAVIQKGVEYNNLGLVVADEQHRFGVSQRAALLQKGDDPHLLVMTATPIPRTLALILYADLDISILNEMPPGRKKVLTYAVGESMRTRVYNFMGRNIKKGAQCYVVCPLIEESETVDLKNASEISKRLERYFPSFKVGLVHGRMKPKEKEEIMERFASHEIDILVSTTVIEVGVDVPNSSIMVIENAERFGLSQLHQLRGRVGRGSEQAYCIMFYEGGGEVTQKRMRIMCESNDGFYISEQDLKLRGPGDFFGTRQHGLPELKAANLFEDMDILKQAREAAIKTFEKKISFKPGEEEELYKKTAGFLSGDTAIN